MIFKAFNDSETFVAGDLTLIKELLHPKKDNIELEYSLAHATVDVGQASEPHILNASSELYYILDGEGEVTVDGEVRRMQKGDAALILAGSTQWIKNIGDIPLTFLCIVAPAWSAEQEVIF